MKSSSFRLCLRVWGDMTKAEISALAWVDSLFVDLIHPGQYAGPKVKNDPFSYDPWPLIEVNLFTSYRRGKVPSKSVGKAKRVVQKEWSKKMAAYARSIGCKKHS